jgi:hypothetical protein
MLGNRRDDRRVQCIAAVLFALLSLIALAADEPTSAERNFALKVWPVIQSRCLPCHGEGKELAGGLDLRTLAGAKRGGESEKPALVAGSKQASPLWRAINRRDAEYSAMPPKENDRLSADELSWFEQWLTDGAPWPDEKRRQAIAAGPNATDTTNTVSVTTSGGLAKEWTDRRYKPADLWAYQPLRRPTPPTPYHRGIRSTLSSHTGCPNLHCRPHREQIAAR